MCALDHDHDRIPYEHMIWSFVVHNILLVSAISTLIHKNIHIATSILIYIYTFDSSLFFARGPCLYPSNPPGGWRTIRLIFKQTQFFATKSIQYCRLPCVVVLRACWFKIVFKVTHKVWKKKTKWISSLHCWCAWSWLERPSWQRMISLIVISVSS